MKIPESTLLSGGDGQSGRSAAKKMPLRWAMAVYDTDLSGVGGHEGVEPAAEGRARSTLVVPELCDHHRGVAVAVNRSIKGGRKLAGATGGGKK